ncbi:MAG: SusC/RagA family TonB-linked outer membrane protein, partial [Gemmatimonadaceae bacterium]|nr:SusC/RagA family TonB-linked outer membrane protein [Gemmatimonadaceae bacterium]
ATAAVAQNAVISGRVASDQGRPLAGANVFITELGLSVGTNEGGNYTITVPGARVRGQTVVLRARAIGQKPDAKSIVLRPGAIRQDFVLAQDVNRLSQVVVTGVTGATEQIKVPFSVARVDEKDMPVAGVNPLTQLQGKVPGASIVSNSGRPGAQPAVLLRAPTSINASGRGQDPLYIVDGVSVEVVKGAAGASLYGARAGNGVIQITTKSGRGLGDNTVRFGFRSEFGGGDIERSFPLAQNHFIAMDETRQLMCDGAGFSAGYSQPCTRVTDIYAEALRINQGGGTFALGARGFRNDGGIATNPGTTRLQNLYQTEQWPVTHDPIGATVTNGTFANSNLDITGRFAGANFFASVSNVTQEGSIRFLDRNSVRLNVSQNFGSRWTVGVNTFYSRLDQDGLNQSGSETGGTTGFFRLTRIPAFVDLQARDQFGRLFIRPNPLAQGSQNENPLYSFQNSRRRDSRGQFGYDRSNGEWQFIEDRGFRTTLANPAVNNGQIDRFSFADQSYNASLNTTARRSFGRLNTKATLRYLYEQQDFRNIFSGGDNIPFQGVENSGALIQNLAVGSGLQSVRQIGMFANLDLDYADRYIVSGLIRRDGSSLFGADNRWATFGRGSVAWRVAQEPWWGVKAISELKLRASIGTAGGRPPFPAQYESFNLLTGGVIAPALLGNRLLGPEVNTETELGVDLELFSKVGLNLTYAESKVRDQILPVPVPLVSGFGTQWRNAGTLSNGVFEASLNVPWVNRPDFTWSTRLNFDRVRSRIAELDVAPFLGGVGLQAADQVFQFREGERLGTFYGRAFARSCDQLPAAFRGQCGAYGSGSQYELNRDGYVVWTGGLAQDSAFSRNYFQARNTPSASNPTPWGAPYNYGMLMPLRDSTNNFELRPLGRTLPNYRWALSNTITWKRLNFYSLVDASIGQRIWNQGLAWSYGDFMINETDQVGRSVTEAKPIGYFYRAEGFGGIGGLYDVLGANQITTLDASYARLRELSLSYRVGRVLGAGNWTVGLVGRNLLTITDYKGFDPETGLTGGNLGSPVLNGIDRYAFPNLRTVTFSIASTF